MQSLLKVAQQAAHSAGHLMLQARKDPSTIQVNEKAPRDLVTSIDKAVERHIIDQIQQHYPDHSILSEEQGLTVGNEFTWVIDPIDGTTNFSRGVPHFATSICVKQQQQPLVGVIFDPSRNEMFTAIHGEGAYLNDQPIHISQQQNLHNALIATGFPSKCQQFFPGFMDCLAAIFPDALGIRRGGAATLDLAYVAAGRLDAYWEIDIREWDIAAGQLLVTEAGGLVSDLAGAQNYPQHGIIAATPGVLTELIANFAPQWQQQFQRLFEQCEAHAPIN